jgi:putative colanic acid biosynthesis acetyltransferase WcaF
MAGVWRLKKISKLKPHTVGQKLCRLAWHLTWTLTCRPTPVFLHRWRALVLRAFGAKIRGKVFVYPNVRVWAPWNLEMEPGSCLGPAVICYNVATVSLGDSVTVSQRSHLCSASHDIDDDTFPLVGAPITIEARAWIAAEAFIGPGVTVGTEGVVLARAVAVSDVAAGAVVAGNPLRHIRFRKKWSNSG